MTCYSRTHLSDHALLDDLAARVGTERGAVAELLASMAEVDARRLYAQEGYPSMIAYCIEKHHLCEQAAYKRILAARTARRFPVIFQAVADGRLHLSAVCLLAPRLTEETAEDLLAASADQSKSEIVRLLAERFPRSEMLAWVTPASESLSPGIVGTTTARPAGSENNPPATVQVDTLAPRPKVAPLAAGRYAVQFTIGQDTQDKLEYAQVLASHQVPPDDLARLFDRALTAYIRVLEKTRFAATDRPSSKQARPSASGRHIPAPVKRAVWERDSGQCTFVSDAGHRCGSRKLLEFDHIEPVSRGGQATVSNLRLRCRAHNQYQAERAFGADFMRGKRDQARRSAELTRVRREKVQHAAERARETAAGAPAHVQEVLPCLRSLGFRAGEARAAAGLCEGMSDATLEQRVRAALSYFHRRRPAPAGDPVAANSGSAG